MRLSTKLRRTVLAVEDDPTIRRAIQKALEDHAEVVFAPTGKAALEALQQHQPAFVLLDYMLPDMDGLAVLGKVRAEPRTKALPVVIFSSLSDQQRIRTALAQGANSWVAKRDDPEEFQQAVQDLAKYWLTLNQS